jgi:hypothetical protein
MPSTTEALDWPNTGRENAPNMQIISTVAIPAFFISIFLRSFGYLMPLMIPGGLPLKSAGDHASNRCGCILCAGFSARALRLEDAQNPCGKMRHADTIIDELVMNS